MRFGRSVSPLVVAACALAIGIWPGLAGAADQQEAICEQPWVLWCENFEDRTSMPDLTRRKFKNPGISVSPSSITNWQGKPGMEIRAGEGFNGSKGNRQNYPAAGPSTTARPPSDIWNGGDGFWVAENWGAQNAGRTLYVRLYFKYSADFGFTNIGSKGPIGIATASGLVTFQPLHQNGPFMQQWPEIRVTPGAVGLGLNGEKGLLSNVNVGAVPFVRDRWYCMEGRATLASGFGTNDGAVEMWLDGVQTHNYSNLQVGPTSGGFQPWAFHNASAYQNCTSPTCQHASDTHPDQERWIDNIVIGTQRIGCLGATTPIPPPPPTSPVPAAPSNLTVR